MASLVRGAGLDARAAAVVMRVVRNIVDTGRTITCTIHQPSVNIFEVLASCPFHRCCSRESHESGLARQIAEQPEKLMLCCLPCPVYNVELRRICHSVKLRSTVTYSDVACLLRGSLLFDRAVLCLCRPLTSCFC